MCRIIAYTFNAAAHCPTCTSDHAATGTLTRKPPLRCETDEHGIALDLVDHEGNDVHPVFSTDECIDGIVCDTCGLVVEPPAPTDDTGFCDGCERECYAEDLSVCGNADDGTFAYCKACREKSERTPRESF